MVQVTFLFIAENWFMSQRISNTLGGFHHRVVRQLVVMRPRKDTMGRWGHPLLNVAMSVVCLEEVYTYILRLHNTIAQYIATRSIRELYLEADQQMGEWVTCRWWEQDELIFE